MDPPHPKPKRMNGLTNMRHDGSDAGHCLAPVFNEVKDLKDGTELLGGLGPHLQTRFVSGEGRKQRSEGSGK